MWLLRANRVPARELIGSLLRCCLLRSKQHLTAQEQPGGFPASVPCYCPLQQSNAAQSCRRAVCWPASFSAASNPSQLKRPLAHRQGHGPNAWFQHYLEHTGDIDGWKHTWWGCRHWPCRLCCFRPGHIPTCGMKPHRLMSFPASASSPGHGPACRRSSTHGRASSSHETGSRTASRSRTL